MATGKKRAGKGPSMSKAAKPTAGGKSATPKSKPNAARPKSAGKAKGAGAPAAYGTPAAAAAAALPPRPASVGPGVASPPLPQGTAGVPLNVARHLDEACGVWAGLTADEQVVLIRELIETRSDELRLAYPGLLSLGYGYRHERVVGKGGRKLQRRQVKYGERCVAFLVADKWRGTSPPAGAAAGRRLPEHLFTYYQSGGGRKLCAVPTDVHGRKQHYRGARLQQANPRVRARSAQRLVHADGVPACAVQMPAGGPTYLLGCHHVFALSKFERTVPPDVVLSDLASGASVGQSCDFFGFVDQEGFFLDAALIELSPQTPVRQVVPEPIPGFTSPQFVHEIADRFIIQTPDGPVGARFVNVWGQFDTLPYLWPVWQKWVVEMEFDGGVRTSEGHSGSPVFDAADPASFQGMHIGRDGGRAFMLPAFELLRAAHYGLTNVEQTLVFA